MVLASLLVATSTALKKFDLDRVTLGTVFGVIANVFVAVFDSSTGRAANSQVNSSQDPPRMMES
jgi:hypothetical protein